jgi:predicted nucleic acid-binding protein
MYLLDNSVIQRFGQPVVAERIVQIGAGDLHVCLPVLLEAGYSVRNAAEHQRVIGRFMAAYGVAWTTEAAQRRAVEVQYLLAQRGQHRSARLADLIIAATAEQAGLTVLHYDRDFDLIAGVTGQPVEWVVPAGSAD